MVLGWFGGGSGVVLRTSSLKELLFKGAPFEEKHKAPGQCQGASSLGKL